MSTNTVEEIEAVHDGVSGEPPVQKERSTALRQTTALRPGVHARTPAGLPADAGANGTDADTPQPFMTDKLYTAFTSVFGNSNPMQLFSMVWPGTPLDYGTYKDDNPANQPLSPLVEIAQSTLFDQFYPIATITQPDGTRVSDRYRQALDSYGPKPNEALIDLQRVLRQRLDQTTTIDVDGQIQKVTLLEKYTILQDRWIAKKQQWSELKSKTLDDYRTSGAPDWWEQYVTWYETVADAYVAAIDAAYNRMIADFPVNEFEDALAILDTHDAAALLRAKQDLRNAQVDVPDSLGSSFYSTQAVPRNWGNALVPCTTFRDLLAAPEAQQRYLNLCADQLRNQIFSWNAVLAQIPDNSKEDIAAALADFNDASNAYFDATAKLVKDYGDNVVVAVKTYMQYTQGSDEEKQVNAETLRQKLDKDNPDPLHKQPINWAEVSSKVNNCQKLLSDDTGSMVKSGQVLGQKATAYLNSRAGEGLRAMIVPVLDKLQTQLATLVDQIRNFDSAASRAIQLNGTGSVANQTDPAALKASPVDDPFGQRWSEISFTISSDNTTQESAASTSFSQTNWGVDFFFGSAGGTSTSQSQSFFSDYVEEGSEVQIGMLATKVLIERPWMHPELFTMSKNFFKAIDTPVSSASPIARGELLAVSMGGSTTSAKALENVQKINQAILPGYPVALLIVKDVTIKIKLQAGKTQVMQSHSEQNSSGGGGFLCFSVSRAQASTADSQSTNSYSMAGDFVFRIPAPQIVGVWNQILPSDRSTYLNGDDLKRILQFKEVERLGRMVAAARPHEEVAPSKPAA